jgi:hypothetical protein
MKNGVEAAKLSTPHYIMLRRDKVVNRIIFIYPHRQECLCYGMKSGFGGTDIPVCVPNITVHLLSISG